VLGAGRGRVGSAEGMETPKRNDEKLEGGTQGGEHKPLDRMVGPDKAVHSGRSIAVDANESRRGPSEQEVDELGMRVSPLGAGPTLGSEADQQTQSPRRDQDENLGRDIGRGKKAQAFLKRNQMQNRNLDNREG
jgi:hypothetical protein